jgi:two-component system nitrate/nitrite response regulator NarL
MKKQFRGRIMTDKIRVAILDDHQGIVDGYLYRLDGEPDIEVVATLLYGEALEPTLAQHPVDVLLLDVHVPTSSDNPSPYPILFLIPKLLQIYPDLAILVISMHAQRTLIHAVMEAGACGYVLKDDQSTIRELASVIRTVADGGIHMSQYAYQQLRKRQTDELEQPLSPRQIEALSLCAAYPNASTIELARKMDIVSSTLRNLLSGAYLKLDVRTRAAAVAKARKMGVLASDVSAIDIRAYGGHTG